ncbi:MAG: hypothetical protein VKO44_05450 [Cyanobacteriota bacterium]|nr:hypothetical protein [Cyanobacteriota bacterium]
MSALVDKKLDEIAATLQRCGSELLLEMTQFWWRTLGPKQTTLTSVLSLAHWRSASASMLILTLATPQVAVKSQMAYSTADSQEEFNFKDWVGTNSIAMG